MRTKVTLVLVFLNVALFFFIFKFERSWRTEAASLEARRRVLGAEAADIRSLQVTSVAPGGSFTLARQRDAWFLTAPLDWPANPQAVSTIVHELQLLEHEASFSTRDLAKGGRSLADYGLDKPKLTVAFTSGDAAAAAGPLPPTILRIGDTTAVGNRLYILSPDGERIHVVNRSLVDSLTLPLEQLRSDALLTIPVFEARQLSVQTAAADQVRGGAVATTARVRIRRDGARWTFDAPIIARAGKAALEVAINRLNALRAKSFVATPPATLPSVAPALRVALEGNNRQETLFLGEPVPATAPAAGPTPETEYYAQLEGRAAVFTVAVPADLLATLRNATEKLRETHVLDFDAHAVTAIALAAPVQSGQAPVVLQRLETPANAAEGGVWQIARRGEGGPGLQTTPADRSAVQRLLTQLAQLAATPGPTYASGFVSDNPSRPELENWGFSRPEREITLTLAPSIPLAGAPAVAAGSPATTVRLQLGTDASRQVFARVVGPTDSGSSIYAVDVDLAAEFPVDPLAWRDRTLATIPANARIVGLKLSEAATKRVLLEAAFDAAGQPTAPLRDAAAVTEVLRQVRTLRAKRFRSEPFADPLVVAGQEQPWKLQLDTTIALPGGTGGEQTETRTLWFTDRLGGALQLAGAKEFATAFELEQPFLDALWTLAYGPRDPGPAPEARKG